VFLPNLIIREINRFLCIQAIVTEAFCTLQVFKRRNVTLNEEDDGGMGDNVQIGIVDSTTGTGT